MSSIVLLAILLVECHQLLFEFKNSIHRLTVAYAHENTPDHLRDIAGNRGLP